MPREYTDHDRHAFLTEAYEYVARYFENSLVELQARHEWVSTAFRPIDANRFEARAFTSDSERVSCGIWLGGSFGTDELYFSFGGVGEGGYNERCRCIPTLTRGLKRSAWHMSGSTKAPPSPWRALPSISGASLSNGSDSRPADPVAATVRNCASGCEHPTFVGSER